MAEKNLLILERSSQNLQKITRNGKTMLEGVFAEFGIENRNGRIYEEKEYLPHLEYLKKDIANGNLLGELDHPERFEVALGSVSHRITELWYDQQARQVKGRIEILEGTPKGQIAKSLLEAGVPLSISSRAAGTVNEDKTVAIQQIYTYDLVAKPGFESAQLHTVNEGANPRQAEINRMIKALNESSTSRKEHSISSSLGVLNENVSVIDLTDKVPITWNGKPGLREEALEILNKNNDNSMKVETKPVNEEAIQKWTELFTSELRAINERLDQIEKSGGNARNLSAIKQYVEKLRKIQEDALNWQSEIAKAVNEVANYADTLADKSNKHYKLTKKIVETVDHNAKTLNATQDWTGEIATVTNAIGNTVDHNAVMLNGMNEWVGNVARGVNKLNEWGEEKAKAINEVHNWVSEIAKATNGMHDWVGDVAKATNGMHEWTSSIAKNLNHSVNWTEDMFGRAVSKGDLMKVIEYVELIEESKKNPELKAKIDEMLKTHSITAKPLNETQLKGIAVIDTVDKIGNTKNYDSSSKNDGVEFDGKTIVSKLRNIKVGREKMPIGNDKLQMRANFSPEKVGGDGLDNDPRELRTGLKRHRSRPAVKYSESIGSTSKQIKDQNLKLDTKAEGRLKENLNKTREIQYRRSNLDNKLETIIQSLEKERSLDETVKAEFPFTQLLSESDRKRFAGLDATDKQKVANEISKVPTTDSKVIIKLWENALASNKVEEPLWIQLAPAAYKKAFNSASKELKESIKARAEFYSLNTPYQIENFWETSGLISRPVITLNESITATSPEESEQKLDSFVAEIGKQMKKYSY
jgi:methyl-accepting chemotaxis protein